MLFGDALEIRYSDIKKAEAVGKPTALIKVLLLSFLKQSHSEEREYLEGSAFDCREDEDDGEDRDVAKARFMEYLKTGWLEMGTLQIFKEIGVPAAKQTRLLKELEQDKLVETKMMGMPAKRHVRVISLLADLRTQHKRHTDAMRKAKR